MEEYFKYYIDNGFNIIGVENQSIITIEEMSELTKEITKMLRKKPRIECLAEEIAHVQIMINQLISYLNIENQVRIEYEKAAFRLKKVYEEKLKQE